MTDLERLAEAVANKVKQAILDHGNANWSGNLPPRDTWHNGSASGAHPNWIQLMWDLDDVTNNSVIEDWDQIQKP